MNISDLSVEFAIMTATSALGTYLLCLKEKCTTPEEISDLEDRFLQALERVPAALKGAFASPDTLDTNALNDVMSLLSRCDYYGSKLTYTWRTNVEIDYVAAEIEKLPEREKTLALRVLHSYRLSFSD